jgi:hypothetical protein
MSRRADTPKVTLSDRELGGLDELRRTSARAARLRGWRGRRTIDDASLFAI